MAKPDKAEKLRKKIPLQITAKFSSLLRVGEDLDEVQIKHIHLETGISSLAIEMDTKTQWYDSQKKNIYCNLLQNFQVFYVSEKI